MGSAEFERYETEPVKNDQAFKQKQFAKNKCINNLLQIDGAKHQWALENKKEDTEIPSWVEITPYFIRPETVKCPEGGVYSINRVDLRPTCSIPGHQMRDAL